MAVALLIMCELTPYSWRMSVVFCNYCTLLQPDAVCVHCSLKGPHHCTVCCICELLNVRK